MKQIVIAMVMTLILVCCLNHILTVESKVIHREDLEHGLETAMLHALSGSMITGADQVEDGEELYADFLSELILQLGPGKAESLDITVYQCDADNGVLDLKVSMSYNLPFGQEETISMRRYACAGT